MTANGASPSPSPADSRSGGARLGRRLAAAAAAVAAGLAAGGLAALVHRGEWGLSMVAFTFALGSGIFAVSLSALLLAAGTATGHAGVRKVGLVSGWVALACAAALVTAPLGRRLAESDVATARAFCESLAPRLEAWREAHGEYPARLPPELRPERWPRLLDQGFYSSNGAEYELTVIDPRALFTWHTLSSGTGRWETVVD